MALESRVASSTWKPKVGAAPAVARTRKIDAGYPTDPVFFRQVSDTGAGVNQEKHRFVRALFCSGSKNFELLAVVSVCTSNSVTSPRVVSELIEDRYTQPAANPPFQYKKWGSSEVADWDSDTAVRILLTAAFSVYWSSVFFVLDRAGSTQQQQQSGCFCA